MKTYKNKNGAQRAVKKALVAASLIAVYDDVEFVKNTDGWFGQVTTDNVEQFASGG